MTTGSHDRNALAAYLDGELPADQERSLQDHLRSCPECAAEIAALVRLRRAMKPAATRFRQNELRARAGYGPPQ
jgi:anti-sigma factor RsiW